MKEAHGLDEVIFIPAAQNPHKSIPGEATPRQRLEMLHLAIDGIPGFSVDERELRRKGVSYTYDTLQEFKNNKRTCRIALILGEDAAESFPKWHKAEEIASQVDLLVGQRPGYTLFLPKDLSPAIAQALKRWLTPIPVMDISSTEIRGRLSKNLYCGHLVPAKVLDYIQGHHLYS